MVIKYINVLNKKFRVVHFDQFRVKEVSKVGSV